MGNKPLYSPEHVKSSLLTKIIDENDAIWEFICGSVYDSSLFEINFKEIREKQPGNIILLVKKGILFIEAINANPQKSQEDWNRAMNCVRLLTKVLPVCFNHPEDSFYKYSLWQNLTIQPTQELVQLEEKKEKKVEIPEEAQQQQQQTQEEIKPENTEEIREEKLEEIQQKQEEIIEAVEKPETIINEEKPHEEPKEAVKEIFVEDPELIQLKEEECRKPRTAILALIDLLVKMLFVPGFTVVSLEKKVGAGEGVLNSINFASNSTMDAHKADILLAIISCVSFPLFNASHQKETYGPYVPESNPYLDYLVRKNPEEADLSQV